MTQQGKYEYKLEIGALSSEVDAIRLQKWSVGLGRNKVSQCKLDLSRTADALTIDVNDRVIFYRREVGDANWGDAFFLGYVKSLGVTDVDVKLIAPCYLGKLAARTVLRFTWGNTEVVDKDYAVTVSNISSREAKRIYCDLDSGLPAQDPLEVVKVLHLREFVNGGDGTTTIEVKDHVTTTTREVAQMFKAREGTLRKVWVKGYRESLTTSDLVVAIQAGDTAPDGTDITSARFSQTLFGHGVGNESWVELDMLNTVSDPLKLCLIPGHTYWLVFRMYVDTSGWRYYLRCATESETPCKRLLKTNYEAGGWSKSPSQRSLFYGIDFDGDWRVLDIYDYLLQGDLDPPRLFFLKGDQVGGDGLGTTYFRGVNFDMLYSGQTAARVTYWKGKINYATVLDKWAETFASDIYDTLDINITEPADKQFVIHGEACDGMKAFNIMRQYAPIIVRVYYNSVGNVVLEVRDELEPSDWAAQGATWKNNRTFRHGFDVLANSAIRILSCQKYKNMVKETDTVAVVDGRGHCVGVQSGVGGHLPSCDMGIIGGVGGDFGDGIGFAVHGYDKLRTIAEGGSMSLSGVDQTYNNGIYRINNANELVKIKSTKVNLDGEFALQDIKWTGGVGQPTKVAITFADVVYDVLIRNKGMDGGTIDFSGGWKPGLTSNLNEPRLGNETVEGQGSGLTDIPHISPSLGQSVRALNDELVHWRDDSYNYDVTKYYYISIGDGVPAGVNLGNKLADTLAKAVVVSIGGVNKAVIMARISEADFGLATAWPKILSEVGLATATSIGGARTAVWAKSFGIPQGTYDFWCSRPEMGRDKTIIISLTVGVP